MNAPPTMTHASLEALVHEKLVSPPDAVAPPIEPQLLSVFSVVNREVSVVLDIVDPVHPPWIPKSSTPLVLMVSVRLVPVVPPSFAELDRVVDWSTPVTAIAPLSIVPYVVEQPVMRSVATVTTTLLAPDVGWDPVGQVCR